MMAETGKGRPSFSAKYLLLGLVVVGLGLRIASFRFNDLPHADIHIDYATAYSFYSTGRLVTPIVAPRPYLLQDWDQFGHPQDQHPPLWPVLGGLLTYFTGDAYVSFKLMPALEHEAELLGLSKHVTLTGRRSRTQDLYSIFDVFVLPSLWEGLPNVLLEAMSASVPIVATDVGGDPS